MINRSLRLRDVLLRIATETDVDKLLPHEWKQQFEREVEGRRNEIIETLVENQGQGKPSAGRMLHATVTKYC